jgi:hypothetical protein
VVKQVREPQDAPWKGVVTDQSYRRCSKRGWSHDTNQSAMLRWVFSSSAHRTVGARRQSMAKF